MQENRQLTLLTIFFVGLCSGESCHRIQVTRGSCIYRYSYVHIHCMHDASTYMSMQVITLYIAARIAIEYVDDVLYVDNNRDMRLYISRL